MSLTKISSVRKGIENCSHNNDYFVKPGKNDRN